jgi:hypothetical protein
MAISTPHPDYALYADQWEMMRDTIEGAGAVKGRGEVYLPMPSGFGAQPDKGTKMYTAYGTRAQFPEIVSPAIGAMVGIIHQSEFQITMPDSMEWLWENATRDGMALEAFHRRITRELLSTGRYGVLVEAPEGGGDPYLAGYAAESIINWSKERDMFVLDESGRVRDGFDWKEQKRFRALLLEDGRYLQRVYTGEDMEQGADVAPAGRGNRALTEIPFVVMSARDVTVEPERPPMIGVARAALAIYRLDADYRHQLYMSGQETLVVINGDAPEAVGAGVVLVMKGDENTRPDAKYVGPSGKGIDAHKVAIEGDREAAAAAGARLFSTESQAQESGEARKLRFGAETANLVSIAQASAAGLEKALRYVAEMAGANPDEVVVKPPANLLTTPMDAQAMSAFIAAWKDGAISYTTLYEALQKGQAASIERDAEDELKLIDDEGVRLADEMEAALLPAPAVNDEQ